MVTLTTAFVKIWGETIGAVYWEESTGIASFEYTKKCIEKDWNLSPIKMSLNVNNPIYSFPELRAWHRNDGFAITGRKRKSSFHDKTI